MALAREKWQIETLAVLDEIFEERCRQMAQHGTAMSDLPDGTGPEVMWLPVRGATLTPAAEIQEDFRYEYERAHPLTRMHLVREEIAEAFQESDPERLSAELLQVAALCVQWREIIRKESSADN